MSEHPKLNRAARRRRDKTPRLERLSRENAQLRQEKRQLEGRLGELEAILSIALPCLECDGTTHPLPVDFYTYECDTCGKQFPRDTVREAHASQ